MTKPELRDISEHSGPVDLPYLQRKIAAAGEMKTAIKRFLDEWDDPSFVNPTAALRRRVGELRKAMEGYQNAGLERVE